MRSQKIRRRPESCHAYHPEVSPHCRLLTIEPPCCQKDQLSNCRLNFISPLQENANDCGGASVISLSASLFLACLSFFPLVSWWWTTLLLQPFSHNDGKDNGSADVFGYWTPEVDLFLKMNRHLTSTGQSLCVSFLFCTFWWQNVSPWINFAEHIQMCTLRAVASVHTSKALFSRLSCIEWTSLPWNTGTTMVGLHVTNIVALSQKMMLHSVSSVSSQRISANTGSLLQSDIDFRPFLKELHNERHIRPIGIIYVYFD